MFKTLVMLSVSTAAWIAVAATSSTLSTDSFALAREFSKRGLHAEAAKELESVIGAQGIAGDELAYRLGEEYRALGRTADSLAQIMPLSKDLEMTMSLTACRMSQLSCM